MNERIRSRIREEMSRQNITQAELARRLGIKQPSVAQILSGKRGTMPESLMDLLGALGLTLEAVPVAEVPAEEGRSAPSAAPAPAEAPEGSQ